jgi:hypothetical protein
MNARVHRGPTESFAQQTLFLFFIFSQKTRARTLDDDNETNTLSGNKKNILFPRDHKRSTGNKILILLPVAHLCNGSNGANGTATKAPPNQTSMARAPYGALLRNALSESSAQKGSFWAHTLLSEFAAFFSLEKGGANAA